MSAWQRIETAPRDGTVILAALHGRRLPELVTWHEDRWVDHADYEGWIDGYGPTHWQPLPEPPKIDA